MSNQLLEQYVKMQVALTAWAYDVRERMREQRGQTTVEWLAIMVGLVALASALFATNAWDKVASAIAGAIEHIVKQVQGKGDG